jgi:fructosamine-3-kinase
MREGPVGRDQLERELSGLNLLARRSGVLTPGTIGIVQVEDKALLIMDAVKAVERGAAQWRQIGRALARIHRIRSNRFGFDSYCYWGDLYQDNAPLEDWAEFFWTRRVEPRLKAAVDSGHLPLRVVPWVEKIGSRLPSLCGPAVSPSLLHGDAHQNNFLSTARGPVCVDPAVYYGHPEMDLAAVDFFSPVAPELFEGYAAEASIDPGFERRRELWRLPARLATVEVGGPRHIERLSDAIRRYV